MGCRDEAVREVGSDHSGLVCHDRNLDFVLRIAGEIAEANLGFRKISFATKEK